VPCGAGRRLEPLHSRCQPSWPLRPGSSLVALCVRDSTLTRRNLTTNPATGAPSMHPAPIIGRKLHRRNTAPNSTYRYRHTHMALATNPGLPGAFSPLLPTNNPHNREKTPLTKDVTASAQKRHPFGQTQEWNLWNPHALLRRRRARIRATLPCLQWPRKGS